MDIYDLGRKFLNTFTQGHPSNLTAAVRIFCVAGAVDHLAQLLKEKNPKLGFDICALGIAAYNPFYGAPLLGVLYYSFKSIENPQSYTHRFSKYMATEYREVLKVVGLVSGVWFFCNSPDHSSFTRFLTWSLSGIQWQVILNHHTGLPPRQ